MIEHEKQPRKALSFRRTTKLLNCGLMSGLMQAIMFNPWDRALYLSVKHERAFLQLENFKSPWAGVTQTVAQRAISAGLYFPLEQLFGEMLHVSSLGEHDHIKPWLTFLAGTFAGIVNGVAMNPFTRIKYHYWGKSAIGQESFYSVALEIFKKGGVKQFFVGTMATVHRDLVFGGTFALLRHEIFPQLLDKYYYHHQDPHAKKKTSHFMINLTAGMVATILSSPINYVRNIHYATSPCAAAQTSYEILRDLWIRSEQEYPRWQDRMHFIQHRLRIGWGTARVGCGMAFGALAYDYFVNLWEK